MIRSRSWHGIGLPMLLMLGEGAAAQVAAPTIATARLAATSEVEAPSMAATSWPSATMPVVDEPGPPSPASPSRDGATLGLHLVSYHSGPQERVTTLYVDQDGRVVDQSTRTTRFNGFNPGVYYRFENQAQVGLYYNSVRRWTVYGGYLATSPRWPLLGLFLGAASGYTVHRRARAIVPIVAPSVRLPMGSDVQANLSWYPDIGRYAVQAFHLSVERRF
ncbi:hypothetical protein [Roseateles amylovorans]|uniref:DUF3575 domain-containing protein n=1 Tax=Roseateles amylovorans TaxID=2978473 RepID=A0ABY6B627_9BURK|nr:hypothetical protein [Roseateles amylovorans]UXH80216.1 hypothetical protein N4261_10190 [Roseateles amylovorans]